jgi:branched-chain amino acid transport system substrate-binding protein
MRLSTILLTTILATHFALETNTLADDAKDLAPIEKVKIGVSVPLTGAAAAYGEDIKNALVFANQKLGNSEYELIIEDDRCLDKEAVTIAHRLVGEQKIKYALGFGCSGTVLASAPVYDRAKAVVIASGTGAPAITNAGDYIFRTKPSLNIAASLLAKDMASKFKKVGALTEETAYCQGLTEAVAKDSQKLHFEVINENFLSDTEDFRSVLLKLKAKGVEAVFLNPQGEPGMVNLFKQFKSLNWDVPVYGTFQPGSPAFTEAFGSSADGIIYADLPFNEDMLSPDGMRLFSEFSQEYGPPKSAEHFAALTLVAFSAFRKALGSGQGVKEYLYKSRFDDLVQGGFSFDENGDVVSEKLTYVLKTLVGGKPARYPR